MSVCDKNCWDCVFRTTLSFYGIVCNYLGVMGRRRGCPPGKECQEKIRGPKRESLEARLYRMPPNPEKKAEEETLTPSVACGASSLREGAKTAEEEKAKAEEAARIAEKKRKKAEQHRAWVARNREHLREYQQEYRKKKAGE